MYKEIAWNLIAVSRRKGEEATCSINDRSRCLGGPTPLKGSPVTLSSLRQNQRLPAGDLSKRMEVTSLLTEIQLITMGACSYTRF